MIAKTGPLNDIPEMTSQDLDAYHSVLILAPHQDDETLGCGGLIQRLIEQNADVSIVFLTDGSMSHPNSSSHSANERSRTRNIEALNALKIMGLPQKKIYFLHAKDSALPNVNESGYRPILEKLYNIVALEEPKLIVCPCQFDPHRDHRAAWSMANNLASKEYIDLWEYPIWIYELGNKDDLAAQQNKKCHYLQLTKHEQQVKLAALKCHRSQIDASIFNDPEGFTLTPRVIDLFSNHRELFFSDRRL